MVWRRFRGRHSESLNTTVGELFRLKMPEDAREYRALQFKSSYDWRRCSLWPSAF